jgi:hypothetical protein
MRHLAELRIPALNRKLSNPKNFNICYDEKIINLLKILTI